MKDFAIELTHRPGELARVAEALSRYGVNIKAEAGVNLRAIYLTGIVDDLVELAIVADNPKKARHALE